MPTLPYPTLGNTTTTLSGLIRYGNTVTDNLFVPGVLLTIYSIIFIYMATQRQWSTLDIAMYAGFSTAMLSIMFKVMNALPNDKILLFAIMSFVIPMMFNLHSDR